MFSAEYQAEKRNFDIDIPLTHEFKIRTLNAERFVWKCTETDRKEKRNSVRRKNSMIVGYKKDIRVSDNVTNTQSDTIIYSKTQRDIQENQPNKGVTKKSMIQQILFQIYTYSRK